MTRKETRKWAQRLAELEQIHQNSSSQEEKLNAEKRIMEITSQIMSDPKNFEAMCDIDELVQTLLNKEK